MFELVLRAPEALVEPVSDALMDELAAVSVSVEDADADTEQEQALFGEPGLPAPREGWQRSTLRALFETEAAATDAATVLLAQDWTAGLQLQSMDRVPDEDWVRLTQSQFDPIHISDRLWIVPSWHAAPDPAAINLVVDPGLAFGTGSHPTTRLCLQWLESVVRPGLSVLDYGCGSGILGIAAARLGASDVLGVDIDEAAITAAKDNAERNGVVLRLQRSREPLNERFDLVVANILTNPLCVLAPLLAARVAPGGKIALSGVLAPQADQVIAAYRPHIVLAVGAEHDGWVRLEGGN